MPEWSQNQLNAITASGGSVIVSAAAGSGKTTVLVERVIRMITDTENGVDADRLLVVTYTRKAAAELRDRLKKALSAKITEEPENAFLLRQQSLLSKAHISTVDSFCMSLSREYFYLLDIDRSVRIADEGELKVLRADALRLTLDTLYTEGDERFHRLVDTFSTARDDSRLEKQISTLYDFLRSHPFPERWMREKLAYFTDFRTVSDSVWGRIVAEYTAEALDYMEQLNDRALDASSFDEELSAKFTPVFESDRAYLERLRTALGEGWDSFRTALGTFTAGQLRAPKGYTEHPSKRTAAAARNVFKKTIEKLKALYAQEEALCLYDIELLKDYAEQLFRAVSLFGENFSMLKKEHNVADYADIEHWVLELVIDENTLERTAVAEEISARFDCIMVDEYQDANEVQDTIFKTLSRGEENLFVVGDVKQSIYRFRQAMPELFLKRKNNAILYDPAAPAFPAKIILDRNYRSDKSILDAVNFVFRKLMTPAVGEIDYNDEEMLRAGTSYPAQDEPAVEFALLDKEGMAEDEAALCEARVIAERILEMVADGYTVTDRVRGETVQRPVTYGDFAVLMFSVKERGLLYREVFELYGIHSHAESSGGFLDAREIMLMTNLLRVIDNPALDIELLSVLMSPVFAFDEDDVTRIRVGLRQGSLYAALTRDAEDGNEKSRAFLDELGYYRGLSATVPLYKLIAVIYERSSFLSIIAASDSSGAAADNLRLLLDYAASYEQNTRRGLSGFIRYLDRLIEEDGTLPAAAHTGGAEDGVTLMTVHGSKGLEFPVCILADTARRFVNEAKNEVLLHPRYGYAQKRYDPVLQAKFNTLPRQALLLETVRDKRSEELRILYVAMTRAKQKLMILSTPTGGVEKYLKNIGEKLIGQREPAPFVVRSCSSMSDWVTMCALLHPDGKLLREYADVDADYESESDFRLSCRIYDRPLGSQESAEETAAEEPVAAADSTVVAELRKHADFTYPYEGLYGLPVKVAASNLAHRFADKKYDRHLDRPAFLSEEKLSSAEKGTALHAFMQFADFTAARKDIGAELSRLTEQGYLTEAQAQSVDLGRAAGFFNSDLVTRCLNADAVYKEYRFNVKISASRVKPEIDPRFADEKIILQGAVDLAFVEGGELVIVDYKTDRVKAPESLRDRYAAQLMLYKEALTECLGLPVKECLIYSIRHSAEVEVYRK